ncbi:hypothetical protein CEXT_391061 [Caerostris extrusa]|uniref:Uncharacterized protein n=1 Tax=Caerostris extrusa TaxID=172846 RepID=A0AAV4Y129_CAEEX|nr:hypothetical protein CEXT_391061 [Caerostris extrusa]
MFEKNDDVLYNLASRSAGKKIEWSFVGDRRIYERNFANNGLKKKKKMLLSTDIYVCQIKLKAAQRGARTHDPEIKSLVLYRLS